MIDVQKRQLFEALWHLHEHDERVGKLDELRDVENLQKTEI